MLTRGTHWLCVEPSPLFTHECRPVRRSNTVFKFVDHITVIGLIATMRKLTEKGYSTRSHDALKLTCCSTLIWWEGEKEAHITPSTWWYYCQVCLQFQVPGDPHHVLDHQHLQPGQQSSPVVLISEDAEEEPPEVYCAIENVPTKSIISLNARHYSRRWKLQTHQRNSIYNHWWRQQDTRVHRAGNNLTRILSHWMEILTIFTSTKPTSILSWVHSFKMKRN